MGEDGSALPQRQPHLILVLQFGFENSTLGYSDRDGSGDIELENDSEIERVGLSACGGVICGEAIRGDGSCGDDTCCEVRGEIVTGGRMSTSNDGKLMEKGVRWRVLASCRKRLDN
ncbi:hypothetical protein BDV96DRAFT_608379 [Lophiotrema nucula]|uniref:Uncharacterized protein n=1 Tax=Lophiotrema nucula TaxID=690887 RepID=A0A6A5YGG6_9PLEO|nr:hypothetical protein BDV96DRAFT_608379 [Lophiotrema nucula]